jgi:polar amino acid transport system substrate-binding protein
MKNYAPFCFENQNGKISGIQPEIVQYIADKLNIKVKHELYPWGRSQIKVKHGHADAMLTTPTPERFEYAIFAKEETCPQIWNLFIRKNDIKMKKAIPSINSLKDLKQYNLIDFIGNGWTQTFMKKSDGFTNIHFVPDPASISLMLVKNRGDLVISSSTLINYHSKNQGIRDQLKEYQINWPWTRFHQVIQVSRKSPWAKTGIIKAIDEATRKMKEEGVYMEILKKYNSPVADGYSFKSQLDDSYIEKHGFYKDYENLPEYQY